MRSFFLETVSFLVWLRSHFGPVEGTYLEPFAADMATAFASVEYHHDSLTVFLSYLPEEGNDKLKNLPSVVAPRPRTGPVSAGAIFYISVHIFFSSFSLSSNSAKCSGGICFPSTFGR